MTDLSGGQQLFPVKTLLCLIVVVRRAHRGLQVIKDLCGDQGAGQQGVRGVLHEPVPGQAHAGQGLSQPILKDPAKLQTKFLLLNDLTFNPSIRIIKSHFYTSILCYLTKSSFLHKTGPQ